VLDIAKTLKPHAWVNVHSGMEAMFVPWDHVATVREWRAGAGHMGLSRRVLRCRDALQSMSLNVLVLYKSCGRE
jgi:hypothetical protein